MDEHTRPGARGVGCSASGLTVIARGTHATIARDPTSMLVRKQFTVTDASERAELARREFECLNRFSAVLTDAPFLHCPTPVSVEPEEGRVWMTYCPGVPLESMLAMADDEVDGYLDHIADQIASAVKKYIREFGEPYFDLAPKNMLYDASTRTLSLVDFSSRRRARHSEPAAASVDVSLACFIGLSTYDIVRPINWRNRTYWRRQEALLVRVLDRLRESGDLHTSRIRQVSAAVYDHSGKTGTFRRRLWYSSVGQALFNRRVTAILAQLSPGSQSAG